MVEDWESKTWCVPEWDRLWLRTGAKYAIVTPDDMEVLPSYREAVKQALEAGTASEVEI